MTAPRALLLAACLVASLAPLAGAGHLLPPAGSGTAHYVSVLVVDGIVRQIDLSIELTCLVDDDPTSNPNGTWLEFACTPNDETLTTCLSTEVSVTQVGGGVETTSSCGDLPPASCTAPAPSATCADTGAGGALPFRCAIFAWHIVGTYQAECYAYF